MVDEVCGEGHSARPRHSLLTCRPPIRVLAREPDKPTVKTVGFFFNADGRRQAHRNARIFQAFSLPPFSVRFPSGPLRPVGAALSGVLSVSRPGRRGLLNAPFPLGQAGGMRRVEPGPGAIPSCDAFPSPPGSLPPPVVRRRRRPPRVGFLPLRPGHDARSRLLAKAG
jgi:hypothetical protein